jgi:hypothetical protein
MCDLEELALADANMKHDYVALSHVWGSIEDGAQFWCLGKGIPII